MSQGSSDTISVVKDMYGPPNWSAADLDAQDWALSLTDGDVEEIWGAVRHFQNLGLTLDHVSQATFPLLEVKVKLDQCARAIHEGIGFTVLTGLTATHLSDEQNTLIHLGISSYIGDHRGLQDRKGNVLAHVTSSELWNVPILERHGIHSNLALPFHNDMGCDILSLQVRKSAASGGATYLSPISRVFQDMVSREPDTAKTLLREDWPVQISGKAQQYLLAPAVTLHEGRLMASLDPNRFGPHPSTDQDHPMPRLSDSQTHALQQVSKIARQNELKLVLKQGDLLFFNNWALLHRRDSYEDEAGAARHLVRLWLRNSQLGWPVPPSMETPWIAAYGPSELQRLYPLVPASEYIRPKYSAGSAAFVIDE